MWWNFKKGHTGRARSVAKSVTWRVIATIDTLIWSWLITHKAVQASMIASTEILTKVPLYYVHERLWRHVALHPDSHLRAILKAISWRFVGSFDTFLRSWMFTGALGAAATIASADAITKIVLYYLHERAWRMVKWGRLEEHDIVPETAAPA